MNDLTGVTYNTKYRMKNTIPDSRILAFVTGFFLGLVFFYFVGKQLIEDSGLMSGEYLNTLKKFAVNQSGYLLYIAGTRLKQFIFVLFCSLSIWAGIFLYAVLGWSGFQLGILFYAAIFQHGIRGVFYCLFMLLPHGFFYALALKITLDKKLNSDTKYYHKNIDISSNTVKKLYEKAGIFFIQILLLGLGILAESYINPWLMKWILLFF